MFLNKINVKMALTFALFSTVISMVIFSALSILISSFLKHEDLVQLQFQAKDMEKQYLRGGIDEIISNIDIEDMRYDGKQYFVRILKKTSYINITPKDGEGISILDALEAVKNINTKSLQNLGVATWLFGPMKWSKSFDYSILDSPNNLGYSTLSSSNSNFNLDVLILETWDGTIIQTGISDHYREQFRRVFKEVFIVLLIPLILMTIIAGLYYSTKTLKPVLDLTKTIRGIIETGKREPTISHYPQNNELAELVTLFNTLFDNNQSLIVSMKETLDNVSHDLRTPLTRIRGASETAITNPNPIVWREAHSDCIEEIDDINHMLNTLLDVTAAENGVLNLNITNFNIYLMLEKTIDLYNFIAEDKMISIDLIFELENPNIVGDEGKIRQVIANLLDNAVKYSNKNGKIVVKIFKNDKNIIIEIKDNGIGMSPDEIPNIWNRLYRATRSRHEPGLGLGLSMVKATITAHKGSVDVISSLGKGSTFIIKLPISIS
ncbi:MAG: hypothetical protein B6229_02680 [Spirochaetaceae bacterium 4572_7]|nr:MAG: hypothetical protein B6229_02680 [Spirochaetaceae bacterium 4572_7]